MLPLCVINKVIKLNDFLTESELAQVYPYGAANTEHDARYNPEAAIMNKLQTARYKELRTAFGGAPVITQESPNPANHDFRTEPRTDEDQSAGYRGKQKALSRAGIADNDYNRINPHDLHIELDNLFAPGRLF